MPRVNDFQDQTATMLQAAMNQRSMNLQSDQAYIDAQFKGQQLKQSMMGMMMGDRLSRDQLSENARQFDDQLEYQESVLTEQKRASRENESLLRDQLKLAKDQFGFTQDVDAREAGLNVINKFETDIEEIADLESKLEALASKRAQGGRLTGAEVRQAKEYQSLLNTKIALAHDTIQNSGELSKLDDDMLETMTGTLKSYAQTSMAGQDFSVEGEGNLTTPFEPVSPTMETKGAISNTMHSFFDNVSRFFTDADRVPGVMQKADADITEVLNPDNNKGFDRNLQRNTTTALTDFAKYGFGDRGAIFGFSDERRDENQLRNLPKVYGMIDKATAAKIMENGKDIGYSGDELREYFAQQWSDPVSKASAMNDILPVEIKQGFEDRRMLERFQEAMVQLAQEGYENPMQGAGAMELMQRMNLTVSPAQKIREIRSRLDADEALFLDPRERKRQQNMINNLLPFGVLSDQEE